MNWYRNAHYSEKNMAKQYFHEAVSDQSWESPTLKKFSVEYKLYYKNKNCDPSNIIALIEKFALDGLKECGCITDDSVKYHTGSSWIVAEQDRDNPRCEIIIKDEGEN